VTQATLRDQHGRRFPPYPAVACPADSTYEVAASWLPEGLDPNRVTFYKQSDLPEVFELTWLLNCVTPKRLMNRAHARQEQRALARRPVSEDGGNSQLPDMRADRAGPGQVVCGPGMDV
jgi:tryptophanyl-tRNA synthetase